MSNTVNGFGQHILVPFDGSPLSAQGFSLAVGLATEGATITILHVEEQKDKSARSDLGLIAERLRSIANGMTIETAVTAGEPAEAILGEADRLGTDLIVMSTRGRGGLARLAFGSVTDQVVRRSHLSVAVIHGDKVHDSATDEAGREPHRFARIVLPLDGTEASGTALPAATELAKRLSIPVLVVSTINLVPLTSPSMVQDIGMAMNVEDVYDETRESAEVWLSEASRRLTSDGVENNTEFLTGSAAYSIESLTKPGDLIVMVTHGRSGIDRVLSGSVSDQLIRSGAAPVLIVRAAAFATTAS